MVKYRSGALILLIKVFKHVYTLFHDPPLPNRGLENEEILEPSYSDLESV